MLIKPEYAAILADHLGVAEQPAWGILDSTKAKSFISCPRKFMYEHVFGWRPEYPSNHLVFGSSLHLALEYLLINGYTPENVIAAHTLFEDDYRKTYGCETDDIFEPKTPINAFFVLVEYAKTWANDLEIYDVLYTEIGGSVSIGEDRDIHFKMDSVLRHKPSGKIISLDHKTASSFYGWDAQFGLSLQTGTYTHVLNCLFEADQVQGVVYNGLQMAKSVKGWASLKNNEPLKVKSPIDFMRVNASKNKHQMNVWLWTINNIYESIMLEYAALAAHDRDYSVLRAFPMREVACQSYGRLCEYHDFCMSWPNPLARAYEPPLGFKQEWWNPVEEPVKETFKLQGEKHGGHSS